MPDYDHLPLEEQVSRLRDDIKIYAMGFAAIKQLPLSILGPDGQESGVAIAQLIIKDCEQILEHRND